MAGSWRVTIEAVRDLDNPTYRVGDFAKMIMSEDVKIKNAVVELSVQGKGEPGAGQITKPFNVDESGSAKINQVLFVQRPEKGHSVLIRVVKPHRVQKDALIGEAEFRQMGKHRLKLSRSGKQRGSLTVNVADGIPVPPPQWPPTPPTGSGTSAGSRARPPPPPTGTAGSRPSTASNAPQIASEKQLGQACNLPLGGTGAFGRGAGGGAAGQGSSGCGGGLAQYFQSFLACGEGLAKKSIQVAGDMAVMQRVFARLGFQDPKAFLERKRNEQGVQRRPSGLLYRIKRSGVGRHHPSEGTPCDCHYRGRLINGKEFDSSYRDGKPARFLPREVIKGWSEALQLMVEGDLWELFIPPELAYGERGVDGVIPGGSVLIFEVELMRVGR